MTAGEPISNSTTRETTPGGLVWALVREHSLALAGWACLIVASLIAFPFTDGTQYHQFAAAILMSSSSLFLLIALFECLWRLFVEQSS